MRLPCLLLVASSVVLGAGGCTASGDDAAAPDDGCTATVEAASRAIEVDEQIALLDTAFVRCRSYDALVDELARHPGIVGYELATFVELRCASTTVDDLVGRSPACRTFQTGAGAPLTTAPDLLFVGETLDGRTIEIRPDADTRFVGAYPEVVQRTVDIASEAGCAGVLEQRDLWAARVGDDAIGDEASVYANHAQNVANFIGCPSDDATDDAVPATATEEG